MSTIYGKVWGTTECLLKTPLIELHRIIVSPESHCSLHMHEKKWNGFYVTRGQLLIECHKEKYDLVDTTVLLEGDFTIVPPGEFHMFRSLELGCTALEIYYPEPLSEDIIRKTVGGSNE
tara:strand:- start:259 stop:615 length:357 start_codon:yes stop_codon:yes gene_type:complete